MVEQYDQTIQKIIFYIITQTKNRKAEKSEIPTKNERKFNKKWNENPTKGE